MKLPNFLSNQTDSRSSSSSTTSTWPWPSCTQTSTLSFRASSNDNNNILKTVNSAFRTTTNPEEPLDSFFTNSSSETTSFSTASEDQSTGGAADSVEAVIQGLRSTERLFFKPEETNSILEEAKTDVVIENSVVPFKESVALSMESRNPYLDFKKSMEEMVEAVGIKEWEGLEELLCWYLKMNGKENHGYIIGAFVDLLVGFMSFNNTKNINVISSKSCSCSSNNCDSPYSPLSFCNASSSSSSSCSSSTTTTATTTPCVSSIGVGELLEDQNIETPCLSSLLESTEEEEGEDDDEASS